MLSNLALGIPVMILCLLLQAALLIPVMRFYSRHRNVALKETFGAAVMVLATIMVALVIGNMLQITLWGGLFFMLGEFRHFNDAVYHSAVNFATLGYGDIVMSEKHRLLGPIESVNGILMIGVSSAALMSILQQVTRGPLGEGDAASSK